MSGDITPVCADCQEQLDHVAKLPGLEGVDLTFLRSPQRTLITRFPLEMDSGETRMVEGYRVQYNDALGPTKGGLRFHQEVEVDEATELAFLMTLKNSLAGLPYGGGKGGIRINPRELSEAEHERMTRRFAREIAHFIGEDVDIPAPDVNTNGDIMLTMLDEYEKIIGTKSPATFTGKPVGKGGSLGRETSTSMGGFFILQEKYADTDKSTLRLTIQGFGNVGSHLARLAHEAGYKVVAVSDSKTGLYDADGLDIPALIEWKKDRKSFLDRDEVKVTNEELLELDAEILAPSALGGVITKSNADNIKAGVILEMANGPIDPDADALLEKRNVEVIPDILANSGGVIGSYFEWVQNKESEEWSEDDVNAKLKEIIVPSYKEVAEHAAKHSISLRQASYVIAIKRIVAAEQNRG